jgi:putative colanic acid biosynthesis UDP-glucose lipid carrier transferase
MIRPHHSKLALLYRMMDSIWISGSLWLVSICFASPWQRYYSAAVVLAIIAFYHFAEMKDLYRSWRSTSLLAEVWQVSALWLKVVAALLLIAGATDWVRAYSRQVILTWFAVVPPILTVWRLLARQCLRELRKRGYNTRRAAIAGTGDLAMNLAYQILTTPWMGIRLLGFYDEEKSIGCPTALASFGTKLADGESVEVEGSLDDLVRDARSGKVDLVYMAFPMREETRMRELIARLADTTASVYMVPGVFTSDLLRSRWIDIAGIPAVSVFESPFYGVEDWAKRIEDVVLSSLILPVIALPMIFIAIGVKLSSAGPALFKQRRYGLDGREIVVWKFRTMTVCEDGLEVPQAKRNDSRMTPFGAFLRRTSLDELPQFINVLQGRMSIVGPRPHAVSHNELYRKQIPGYMLRHKVKPGITGWAQVNGWRGETDTLGKMQKRVEYDLYYINHWSLWLDLKIVLLTLLTGFVGKNAY